MDKRRSNDEHIALFARYGARVASLSPLAWDRIRVRCAELDGPAFHSVVKRAVLAARPYELYSRPTTADTWSRTDRQCLPGGSKEHRISGPKSPPNSTRRHRPNCEDRGAAGRAQENQRPMPASMRANASATAVRAAGQACSATIGSLQQTLTPCTASSKPRFRSQSWDVR